MSDELHCPECGSVNFQWNVRHVEYGSVIDTGFHRRPHKKHDGEVLDVSDDVFCCDCGGAWSTEQLEKEE